MATIVDGRSLAREIEEAVGRSVAEVMASGGIPPGIAILQFGGAAADIYTRQLQRAFGRIGVEAQVHQMDPAVPLPEACNLIDRLSRAAAVHGIQIQAPLPPHLPLEALAESLDPAKDLDGVHPKNAGLLAQGRPSVVPATAQAALEILAHYEVPIAGSRVVVVGRSPLVGRPAALLLLQHDATVTLCHSKTRDLAGVVRQAEILVVAAGRPGLITTAMVQPGAAVLDFGTTVIDGRVAGDVEPNVAEHAAVFTPVPGGTGPVTTAMLLRNAFALYAGAVGAAQ